MGQQTPLEKEKMRITNIFGTDNSKGHPRLMF